MFYKCVYSCTRCFAVVSGINNLTCLLWRTPGNRWLYQSISTLIYVWWNFTLSYKCCKWREIANIYLVLLVIVTGFLINLLGW
jgi:hypothetical protein